MSAKAPEGSSHTLKQDQNPIVPRDQNPQKQSTCSLGRKISAWRSKPHPTLRKVGMALAIIAIIGVVLVAAGLTLHYTVGLKEAWSATQKFFAHKIDLTVGKALLYFGLPGVGLGVAPFAIKAALDKYKARKEKQLEEGWENVSNTPKNDHEEDSQHETTTSTQDRSKNEEQEKTTAQLKNELFGDSKSTLFGD